jgi:hypothetical protein
MTQATTLSAIYCDDIRNEVGGKYSLMGVYQSEMVFPQFPALAPKFCARITLRFAVDDRPRESLKIQLFSGDILLGAMEINQEQIQSSELPPQDPDIPPEDRILAIQTALIFSPFPIEAPCRLRLRAYVDGSEIKGNGLKIRLPSPEERAINGWPPEAESVPAA